MKAAYLLILLSIITTNTFCFEGNQSEFKNLENRYQEVGHRPSQNEIYGLWNGACFSDENEKAYCYLGCKQHINLDKRISFSCAILKSSSKLDKKSVEKRVHYKLTNSKILKIVGFSRDELCFNEYINNFQSDQSFCLKSYSRKSNRSIMLKVVNNDTYINVEFGTFAKLK